MILIKKQIIKAKQVKKENPINFITLYIFEV